MWYSRDGLLSYNRVLNFLVGSRGHGKTFAFKDWCISDFLKKGKQFVWVRRYKPQIKLVVPAFFADIAFKYPDHKLTTNKNKAFIDGKEAGTFIPLVKASDYKSVPFPQVNKIVYDEFITNPKKHEYYIANEPTEFLDLFSTVARTRDDVRAIFIANSVTVANPYFSYFSVYPDMEKRFTCTPSICIENDNSDEEFKNVMYETRFGQLIKGTVYGDYAIENDFLLDNDEYVVDAMPQNTNYQCTLAHLGRYYGVYFNFLYQMVYVKERKDLKGGLAIAITKDDITQDAVLARSQNISSLMSTIKEMFSRGRVRYSDIKTKAGFYEIMRVLCVK